MTELTNLKMDDKDYGDDCCSPCEISKPEYPYGLEVCLCDEVLDKLGVTELPKVGETMIIQCQVTVCSTAENSMQGGDVERRMSLQITDMALSASLPAAKTDAANAMYGDS